MIKSHFSVHVIHVSDRLNREGQYEYAILAVNCNYPLFVIARDPLEFNQVYCSFGLIYTDELILLHSITVRQVFFDNIVELLINLFSF
jgi:hypothetical protein